MKKERGEAMITKGKWKAYKDYVVDEQSNIIFAPCPRWRPYEEGVANG